MTSIVQSVFTLLLGIALSFFGVAHSVLRFPGSKAFSQLAAGLPALGSVLLFVLCILAAIAGVVVVVLSTMRLRLRWRYLREVTSGRRPRQYHDNGEIEDEERWAGAYR